MEWIPLLRSRITSVDEPRHVSVKLLAGRQSCSSVIGPKGAQRKAIEQETRASVKVHDPDGTNDEQVITVSGTPEAVDFALHRTLPLLQINVYRNVEYPPTAPL